MQRSEPIFMGQPVGDRLGSGLVDIDRLELAKGRAEGSALPAAQNQDLVSAVFFGRKSADLDLLALAKRRDRAPLHAIGLEREAQLLLKVVIPAERALFLGIRIDDDLLYDARFPFEFGFLTGGAMI